MGGLNRNFDYLHMHDNVRRRVRNLETGVHPTGSHLRYYDSFGPTNIDLSSAASPIFQIFTYWRWQRRVGIVTMSGGFAKKSGGAAWTDDVKIGTLPAEGRPMTDLQVLVPVTNPGTAGKSHAQVTIETNGDMTLLHQGGWSAVPSIRFEGPTWSVN